MSNPPKPSDDTRSEPSFGNMSDKHWSRTRGETNREALEYYRARSTAPGVAEGGAARNFYCMKCDGVIPHAPPIEKCPHCGEPVDTNVKRYFNWVEMGEPPASDTRFLMLAVGSIGVVAVGGVTWLVVYMLSSS